MSTILDTLYGDPVIDTVAEFEDRRECTGSRYIYTTSSRHRSRARTSPRRCVCNRLGILSDALLIYTTTRDTVYELEALPEVMDLDTVFIYTAILCPTLMPHVNKKGHFPCPDFKVEFRTMDFAFVYCFVNVFTFYRKEGEMMG